MKGNIYIPKPCHENWNKMTSQEQGRHCAVCSKVVTDFTKMKTEEIVSTIQNSSNDVCGRININQLTPVSNQQNFYFWIRGTVAPKIRYAVFAILGLAALYKKSAYSQALPGGISIQVKGETKYQPESTQKRKVNIEVVDEYNRPVINATVRIILHGNDLSNTQTNKEGKISTTIEMEQVGYSFITLEVSAKGYVVKEIKDIRITKDNQTIRVKLDENVIIMGKMKRVEEPMKVIPEIDTIKKQINESVHIEMENIILINSQPEIHPLDIESVELLNLNNEKDASEFSWNSFTHQNHTALSFISFPNPTLGDVTIETKQEEPFDIKIYNEAGVLILQQTNQYKRVVVSLYEHPAAIYFAIIFINNKAIETHKIILVK